METNHIGSCFFGFNQQKKWEYKTHLKEAMGESVQKMGKHGRLKWENDDNHWMKSEIEPKNGQLIALVGEGMTHI